jgi:type I restriction enzyme S subunit
MNNYVQLGDLIKTISKTHKFEKDELVFLNTSDVSEGNILVNHYTPVSNLKGQAKKTIQNGDILYSEIRPKNRRYAYVKNLHNTEDYVVSTKLMVLRNSSTRLNTDYLYHFLTYEGTINYLQRRAENRIGSFPQITFDVLKKLQIWLPDIALQQKIAKVLSDLDAKIQLNKKINDNLEQMAKMLYDYWFVQFDFPDVNGKPYKASGGKMVWNAELNRELPVGWENGCLSDIANITMGQSPPGESYNEEGNGMIFYQGCTDFGSRYPTIRKFTTSPTRFAKQGDILLSVRAPVGTLNISKEDCCIGRGLASMNSNNNTITYLFGVMVNLRQIFDRRNVSGTTFGSITKDDLFSLPVIIPNEKTVASFQNLVFPAFDKQNKIELENIELASIRDWLLPMLMNGQITVQK